VSKATHNSNTAEIMAESGEEVRCLCGACGAFLLVVPLFPCHSSWRITAARMQAGPRLWAELLT